MSSARLEHVNITVRNARKTANRLCQLFGWKIRWHGPALNDGYTYHIGGEDQYLAIYNVAEGTESHPPSSEYYVGRLNHIGVVVDDLDALEQRVQAAGYKPFNYREYDPGRRFYFYDEDHIEFEIVSYTPVSGRNPVSGS